MRRWRRRLLVALGIVFVIAFVVLRVAPVERARNAAATDPATAPRYNVGYRTIEFTYTVPGGRTKPLTVAVWYPTQAPPKSFNYNRPEEPAGLVAVNAPVYLVAGKPNPLIVFSHGFIGCATVYSYMNQQLAARGYIVAAPDHDDSLVCAINGGTGPGDNSHPEERPRDISATITKLFAFNDDSASPFYHTIDESAVGVAGHSAGGLTAQQVAGLSPDYHDQRVKAALMLAATTGSLPASDYANLDVPVMYEVGQFDTKDLKGTPRRFPYDHAKPPKFLVIVKRAGHLSFDDTDCTGARTINDCQKIRPHVAVEIEYATAFFDYFLKHDAASKAVLTTSDPRLSGYEYEFGSSAGAS